jgi:hypothetical protein
MVSKFSSIQELAYHLWIARGCPEGSADADWHEAERQLKQHQQPMDAIDDSLQTTFAASDSPASRFPDSPRLTTRTRAGGRPNRRGNSSPLR